MWFGYLWELGEVHSWKEEKHWKPTASTTSCCHQVRNGAQVTLMNVTNKATYEKLQVTAKVECCWEKSREEQGVQRRLVKQGGAGRSQRRGTALGTTSHTQHKTLQRKSEGRGALATSMAAASSKQCPAPDKRNSSYGGESLPAPISRHTTVLHNMCGSKK